MKEIWKDIPNFEGLYQASNLGRIKSLQRFQKNHSKLQLKEEKIMKQSYGSGNYLRVSLCKNGKSKNYRVHRLIMGTFCGENKLLDINHKDGNKSNNKLNNLEYCSRSENIKHAYELKLHKPNSKIVMQYDLDNNLIKEWQSTMEIERSLKFSNSCISACCIGKLKTAYGYKWRYKDDISN